MRRIGGFGRQLPLWTLRGRHAPFTRSRLPEPPLYKTEKDLEKIQPLDGSTLLRPEEMGVKRAAAA